MDLYYELFAHHNESTAEVQSRVYMPCAVVQCRETVCAVALERCAAA